MKLRILCTFCENHIIFLTHFLHVSLLEEDPDEEDDLPKDFKLSDSDDNYALGLKEKSEPLSISEFNSLMWPS